MESDSGFSLAIASQPFQQHWTTIETDDAQDDKMVLMSVVVVMSVVV